MDAGNIATGVALIGEKSMWVRYILNGSKPEHCWIDDDVRESEIGEYLNDMTRFETNADSKRIQWQIIDRPPEDFIDKEIVNTHNRIMVAVDYFNILKALKRFPH